jgi:hypothetical protein
MIDTSVMVAQYTGDLEEATKRYDAGFMHTQNPDNTVFFLYRDSPEQPLIRVKKIDGSEQFNTVFSVTSRDSALNRRIAQEFREMTGLELVSAPDDLVRTENMNSYKFELLVDFLHTGNLY